MNLQHQAVLNAAVDRGITLTDLADLGEAQAALLRLRDQEELLVDGHFLSLLDLHSKKVCDNKQLTKRLFARLGIPAPDSLVLREPVAEQEKIAAFLAAGTACVCKPLDACGGADVRMDVRAFSEVRGYWHALQGRYEAFLLEEQKSGYDLRLQALGGKLAAACTRQPAFVVGDGANDVASLVRARQALIAGQNPANRLDMDTGMLNLLAAQGLALRSVPSPGRRVQLGRLANMSLGAIATDVTDEVDPGFAAWVERIAAQTGMTLFALDVITNDHRTYAPDTAWGIEVNALPEWLHHTFSEGRQHDVAGMLVDDVFGLGGRSKTARLRRECTDG